MAISVFDHRHYYPDTRADIVDSMIDPTGGEVYRSNLAGIRGAK